MSTTQHVREMHTIPAAQPETFGAFVFPGGRALAPTEIAVLRIFAGAGIRPQCIIAGTDRAPDAAAYRAALSAPTTSSPAAS